MVKIVIENLGQKEVNITDTDKSVLHQLHAHFIDWMHACGGKGRCTTCKMTVIAGKEHLSPLTHAEKKYAKEGLLKEDERLACQVTIRSGSLIIRVPEESKLPHVHYTS
ncbi:MAG TPA: 2Fe-2S iron-sulfur cluster-binding protein [Cyclobacteriaceae bacterium]|nr:2Fe-2S iron-sulfur cluster-binding protein [Cyclobacteriaceae bacterium]